MSTLRVKAPTKILIQLFAEEEGIEVLDKDFVPHV